MLEVDIEHPLGALAFSAKVEIDSHAVGIFGPSGAGKTSLLHFIAGLMKPKCGRIVLEDRVLCDTHKGVFVPVEDRRIGVVFQDARLFPHLSVRENLLYGRKRMRARPQRLMVDEIVYLLDLEPLLDRDVHALSGGEAQRVSLGRTLLSEPSLLLLDEPLSALDKPLKAQIIPFLKRVRDTMDIPMMMVSHAMDEVMQLCSHVLLMKNGAVEGFSHVEALGSEQKMLAHLVEAGMRNVLTVLPDKADLDAGFQLALLDQRHGHAGHPVRIALPNWALPSSAPAQVTVRPSDIIIAANRLENVSVRNQFPARVRELVPVQGNVLLGLDIGSTVWAEITRESAQYLNIEPGVEVMCLIKTNSWELV